jgi:hypothetical protein
MARLMDVITTINTIEGQISTQQSSINGFKSSNQNNIQLVTTALTGGQHGHDQKMLAALVKVEECLSKSETALTKAAQDAAKARSI